MGTDLMPNTFLEVPPLPEILFPILSFPAEPSPESPLSSSPSWKGQASASRGTEAEAPGAGLPLTSGLAPGYRLTSLLPGFLSKAEVLTFATETPLIRQV